MRSIADSLVKFQKTISSNGYHSLERTGSRLCQHCGQPVQPLRFDEAGQPTTDPAQTVYEVVPRYCSCPGGRAEETAAESEAARQEWLSRARQLIVKLDIGRYSEYRFSTWDNRRNGASSKAAGEAIRSYVADVVAGRTKRWLYLYGPYGVGKTHLAIAATRQIAAESLADPYVAVWPQHCSQVQESWSRSQGEAVTPEHKLWASMRHAGILLLDDIDKQRATPWALQKLYEVVDYRVIRDKPTIITANHSIVALRGEWASAREDHIRDTGAAILSRVAGQIYTSVEFAGKDQRWAGG